MSFKVRVISSRTLVLGGEGEEGVVGRRRKRGC